MKIAYLEDSVEFASLVCTWLRRAGYTVEWFTNGGKCAKAVTEDIFDACILDWMVPGMTGPEVMERMKLKLRDAIPPVIFTTARDDEEDIVKVLNAGADDYVVKPVSEAILLARLNAVLRRKQVDCAEEIQKIGRLQIDCAKRIILLNGQATALSERELDLALYLLRNRERLLTREHLNKVLWGISSNIDTRTVDVHASVLRKKLLLVPEEGWRLSSVYGRGYRLERLAV